MSSEQSNGTASSGVEGLDFILSGGFPRNRVYLIQGDPGVGKTTVGMQFLLEGARQGERGLYISLSETEPELRQMAASHGWDLTGIEIHEHSVGEQTLTQEGENTLFKPSEIELGETTKSLLEAVERIRPARVVFDSLSEIRLLAQTGFRYRKQILALKHYFVGRENTVLFLDDRTAEFNDIQLQSVPHGVVEMEHLSPEYGAERRRMRVVKVRGVKFRGGYHDFLINTGGTRVFPRLVAAESRSGFEPTETRSGIDRLDELLGGGIMRGSSTLIMGPAGSGKSTLASQWAAAAGQRGERAAIFTFDESKETLLQRSRGLGIHIEPLLESGMLTLDQVDAAEMSPGQFAHLVKDRVSSLGARIVVIDSLNGYMNAMPEERFLTLHMHELLSYLGQEGVATIMIAAQHGLIGTSMVSPIDISYLADCVILTRYFEAQGEIRHALSVMKKRSGYHERTIREFRLSDKGIFVGEPLREFRGIISGTPVYQGNPNPLLGEKGEA